MKRIVKVLVVTIILLAAILAGYSVLSEKDVEKYEPIIEGGGNPEDVQTESLPLQTAVQETEESQTEQTEMAEPETTAPVQVELMMVGDMLLHDAVQNTGLMPDGTYNYDHFFKHIKQEILQADVAVVNQEVIIGGAEFGIQTYPCFNCREEVGDALVKAGFDVVLHATNHAMDQGQRAADKCMDFWESRYPQITYLGIHRTREDYDRISIYEKDGFKIAMLNYTYGLNGISLPADRPYLVNLLDEEKIIRDLQLAEEQADFTIVYPHWGTEYVYEPDANQKKWAQLFADYGADLVIGTHPHVIEPVEWIEGVKGNKTLVYYSLGNFISGQHEAPRMLGAMAQVTLEKGANGEAYIAGYGVVPLVTHRVFGCGEICTYKLSDYNDELAAQNTIVSEDSSFSMSMMQELCSQVFGELYVYDRKN